MVLEYEVSIQYAQVFGTTDIEGVSVGHRDPGLLTGYLESQTHGKVTRRL